MDAHRTRLITVLREIYDVDRDDRGDVFRLRSLTAYSGRTVALTASARTVAAYVERTRARALRALGAVGGDPTGTIAAIGLLGVDIEDIIESDDAVQHVRVTPHGARRVSAPGDRAGFSF